MYVIIISSSIITLQSGLFQWVPITDTDHMDLL